MPFREKTSPQPSAAEPIHRVPDRPSAGAEASASGELPHHPTARALRQTAVLQAQRRSGNHAAQRAIQRDGKGEPFQPEATRSPDVHLAFLNDEIVEEVAVKNARKAPAGTKFQWRWGAYDTKEVEPGPAAARGPKGKLRLRAKKVGSSFATPEVESSQELKPGAAGAADVTKAAPVEIGVEEPQTEWGVRVTPATGTKALERDMATNKVYRGDTYRVTASFPNVAKAAKAGLDVSATATGSLEMPPGKWVGDKYVWETKLDKGGAYSLRYRMSAPGMAKPEEYVENINVQVAPPSDGVVQAWMYSQIDGWHTGATQGLNTFLGTVRGKSSVGFWMGLAGNVTWALGSFGAPPVAVTVGLIGVAVGTIGSVVQAHSDQDEDKRIGAIASDYLTGFNKSRTEMTNKTIAESTRVMELPAYKTAVGKAQSDEDWQAVIRKEAGVPEGDVNLVARNTELNLYNKYLQDRGAFLRHDTFHLPSPHHPGFESSDRYPGTNDRRVFAEGVPTAVRERLKEMKVDIADQSVIQIPHRERDMYPKEGTIGSIKYWNAHEHTAFPANWTDEDKKKFLKEHPELAKDSEDVIH